MTEAFEPINVAEQLANRSVEYLLVDNQMRPQEVAGPATVFPGAFNPLHAGHQRIAALAEHRLQRRVVFELSIKNVDKPPLASAEIHQRVRQFSPGELVYLTRAATFAEKATLFEEACFLVGADTVQRIGELRYYGGEASERDRAVASLSERGCSFLVFGRLINGTFRTLEALELPESLRRICEGLEEEEFRVDVSSTSLRQQAQPER